jgi:uncharacterized protein YdaL
MPQPINHNIIFDDLSSRFQAYKTVDASPSGSSETIIATLTLANFNDISIVSRVQLRGFAAFTAGTNGVSANLRIRKTDVNGTVIAATGATTVTAANLYALEVAGWENAPGTSVYVLTLTVGSGSAASTVSALMLDAVLI